MPRFTAIERAATLLRDPLCVARMRTEALPYDVSTLLRILAGDVEAEAHASQILGKPTATVREAAEFYVTQVLFHSTSDAYRILGSRPDAPREELRTNLALLMRWLHPDVAGPQHRALAERIIKAWNDLKAPEARLALDENLAKTREKGRRRRRDLGRRLEQRSIGQRARPTEKARLAEKAKTGTDKRKKVVFAVVVAVVVLVGSAAYLPADTFAGASQLVSSLLESVEPLSAPSGPQTDNGGSDGNRDATNSP